MSERPAGIRLVAGGPAHREFVAALSAEVFSRFGSYHETLPPMLDWPWVRTFVAEADGAPVGFAMVSLERLLSGEIDLPAIAVSPRWQSRGVGRRLLEHAESEAGRLVRGGPLRLRLTVAEDNAPARRLFQRAGYAEIPGDRGFYPAGQRSLGLAKRIR